MLDENMGLLRRGVTILQEFSHRFCTEIMGMQRGLPAAQGLVPVLNTPGSASGGSLQSLVMCAWPFGGGAGWLSDMMWRVLRCITVAGRGNGHPPLCPAVR